MKTNTNTRIANSQAFKDFQKTVVVFSWRNLKEFIAARSLTPKLPACTKRINWRMPADEWLREERAPTPQVPF